MQKTRSLSSQWLRSVFGVERHATIPAPPAFLYPALHAQHIATTSTRWHPKHEPVRRNQARHIRWQHTHAGAEIPAENITPPPELPSAQTLPTQCFGCGALSQTTTPGRAGYYDLKRRAVKEFLRPSTPKPEPEPTEEDQVVKDTLQALDLEVLKGLGVDIQSLLPGTPSDTDLPSSNANSSEKPPLCDRCHQLVYYRKGESIFHPSIESLHETIEQSPFKYNHVYHVLDAADFPMSLLPKIGALLDVMPLRSRNRRSKTGKFYGGRKIEMSFIITRSDLLAPTKAQVDSLVPYLTDVLRDALGRSGRNIRLGNVRCVSAKRSWWTKQLKEDIWERGGAGWMVGKVNVGKSQLFEAVFPKGRMDWPASQHQIAIPVFPRALDADGPKWQGPSGLPEDDMDGTDAETVSAAKADEVPLLPPPRPETQYPDMPVVSSLPGTTASPIRVPFGNGKGELIDLPGLSRGDLELFVKEEHRQSLIMKSRVTPEQQVIKPNQSLLIGGLIRLTPRTPDLIFLAYSFTPIEAHLTSTDKAIAIQAQAEGAPRVGNIAVPGAGEKMGLAGSFELRHDVTRQRTGPITRRNAAHIGVDRLPYRVVAADILIEGLGWVEVVAQVRTRELFAPKPKSLESATEEAKKKPYSDPTILQTLDLSEPDPETEEKPKKKAAKQDDDDPYDWGERKETAEEKVEEELNWPVIDVFSPEGRFVSSRRPMNAWMLNKPRKTKANSRQRPRKSMKGVKKSEKVARRAAAAAGDAA